MSNNLVLKRRRKKPHKPMRKLATFYITDEDMAKIKRKADRYALGNMSEWMRYATTECDPPESDLIEVAR